MARDSPCSARRRPRRLGVCQGWLPHVGRVGGVGRHDVRRREGRGRGPPPAWRRGLRCSPRLDEARPWLGCRTSQWGFPENAGSERGARVSRLTPGRPLGNRQVCQGRAGLPTPHRHGRRRTVAGILRRRRAAGSVSRASCLSCDSFLLESRSAPHGASVGRSWRWPRCCPRRRSCPSPGRRGWC